VWTFSPDATQLAWSEKDGTVRVRSFNGVWLQNLKVAAWKQITSTFRRWATSWPQLFEWLDPHLGVEDGELLQTIRSRA